MSRGGPSTVSLWSVFLCLFPLFFPEATKRSPSNSRHCFAVPCTALLCIALLGIALLCIALHCFALLCVALHHFALHCLALHRFALLCLHCFALPCIALHCLAFDKEGGINLDVCLYNFSTWYFPRGINQDACLWKGRKPRTPSRFFLRSKESQETFCFLNFRRKKTWRSFFVFVLLSKTVFKILFMRLVISIDKLETFLCFRPFRKWCQDSYIQVVSTTMVQQFWDMVPLLWELKCIGYGVELWRFKHFKFSAIPAMVPQAFFRFSIVAGLTDAHRGTNHFGTWATI